MIYIIIGKDNATGNEWVEHETFEKSLPAAERCQILNNLNHDAVYRVDTVEPRPAPRADYNEMLISQVGSFTEAELFRGLSSACQECGALVGIFDKHVDWHNKLLP